MIPGIIIAGNGQVVGTSQTYKSRSTCNKGIASVRKCAAEAKDYERFKASLDHTFEMMDAMGVNYCLDYKGLIGLDRQPARTPEELEQYLKDNPRSW